MNHFSFLTSAWVLLSVLNLWTANGQSVYSEDFDLLENWTGGSAGSYNAKFYAHVAEPLNDQFSSDNAVRESTGSMTGYAWRLRNAGTPFFLYECEEQVASFSVFLAHWNPANPLNVTIEFSVNSGVSYVLAASLDETWWSGQGFGEKEYRQFFSGDLNIIPESGEKIYIRIMTDGNERLLIDNFQLFYTSGSAGVQNPQDFSAITASNSQINLVFVPNIANDGVVIVFDPDGSFDDPAGSPPASGQPFAGGTLFYSGLESPQAHSGLMPGQTVFYKAWSFNGIDYSEGLLAQATTMGSAAMPNAWINEMHYDNDGSDVNEFVEIVIEHPELYDLVNFEVFLYNGSTGEVYAAETADNFEPGQSANNYSVFTWGYPGIQNGSPEGVALAMNGILVTGQFLSYEGTFTGTNGPAAGNLSVDIGVEEPTANPVGFSLQLAGSGLYYEHFYWTEPSDETPGLFNNSQEIGNFTAWTGMVNNDWNNDGNWDNGMPSSLLNALIPDAGSGIANSPLITDFAEVADLVTEQGSMLEIDVQGALTVFGTFASNGTLTIRSDATGTGSLIESTGVIASAEQYLVPGQWHYISSPVADIYSDVYEGMYLMEWDEPSETWNFIEEMGVPLNGGLHGYGVWTEAASTVAFSGWLNTGDFSMNVSNTEGTANPENDPSGYNLAGNPYPSSLDWDAGEGSGWTRTSTNVALSIYFWDGTQYASYVKDGPNPGPNGGTNVIPPHQGFFVKCITHEGGSISVNNQARIHATQPFYKKTNEKTDFIRLKLNGNELSDELVVHINENATFGFDPAFDAFKLFGCEEAPQIFSLANDNSKLSINAIPEIPHNLIIPLGFRSGDEGLNELILNEIDGFDDVPVYLEDLQEQCVIDLKLATSYKFSSVQGNFDERFVLHLGEDEIPVHQKIYDFETPLIFVREKKVVVSANKPLSGNILISDLWGRKIVTTRVLNAVHLELDMKDQHGWYIVRIISGAGTHNYKVFIAR